MLHAAVLEGLRIGQYLGQCMRSLAVDRNIANAHDRPSGLFSTRTCMYITVRYMYMDTCIEWGMGS